jgi:exosortase A-associated hydrolase 2
LKRSRFEPLFIEQDGARLFALLRSAQSARRCVLFIPAFCEEMNKCRRQVSVTAARLVECGYATLTFDLQGTGDSSGAFEAAGWSLWKKDVAAAIDWIDKNGFELDSVVAARLGCALAADALEDLGRGPRRTVFWQPVDSGRRFMGQFLRLRIAAAMMETGKETVEQVRAMLAAGESVEIAGYSLPGDLWRSVEDIQLADLLSRNLGELGVMEIGRSETGQLSPPGQELVRRAEQSGIVAAGYRVTGQPFWSSTEIVVSPALVDSTVEFIMETEA